ncbi:Down syndrome cell adhesion molecule-like protein 1 homolog isoform X2 [Neolamprologus brichardi]|uniref:Down syndrome cell adhesion molecule-like protein 1 homolog isoform X2 n=1 Tax=Neolamprologus brichardi TaxID=32507 RepID=UPI0003EC383A|nr:Down syndrome cell adhesion molecule-like protein 1 homolog isoform X2 [Neolamprologus brichardi]
MIILASKHLAVYCNLLFCFLAGFVSAETVTVTVGTDAILKCSYDANYYGRLSACWGKGTIPNSGCANEVLKTDGTSVISRLSERYLLMGNLGQGDVSLTIRHAEEQDSGVYGCRVEIPGWFNDQKHHVTLKVNAVPPNPLRIEAREVKERTVTIRWSPVFDGGRPITAYRVDIKNKQTPWETKKTTELHDPSLTHVTLVDLSPSKTYNLRVFAINSVGMSETSNVLTITAKEAAPEGPPLDMQLVALSSSSIKVTWKPPRAELRNGVLRGYNINYREFDPVAKQFKRWQYLTVAATREQETVTLVNLKPSTMYGVLIQAKTIAGVGPASNAPLCSTLDEIYATSATSTTSAAPSTSATSTTSTTPSTSATSTTSTTPSTSATSTTSTTPSPSAISITFYAATVWEQSTASISGVPPDPPVIELKKVDGNSFSLFWDISSEGDSPITGYFLEYKAVNASWDYTKNAVDFGAHETEATIIEMNPSTYNVRMFAKNSQATSAASNVLTITTGEAGHQKDILITSMMPYTASPLNSPSHHLIGIFVAVGLLVVTGAILTTWQLRRLKQKKGTLSIWLGNGEVRYTDCESLHEL